MFNTIIIGSGISGLFTLKHLLEEGINNVLVIDKNHHPSLVNVANNHWVRTSKSTSNSSFAQ